MTGLAAVSAALAIGLRQSSISRKQNEILDRQTQLAELQLRSQLFDKRLACYHDARQFLGKIVAHADRPDRESEFTFIGAMHESLFLFDSAVHQHLMAIWRDACDFCAVHAVTRATFDREGHYGPEVEREHELLEKIADHLGNFNDVFGEEMRLSAKQIKTLGV